MKRQRHVWTAALLAATVSLHQVGCATTDDGPAEEEAAPAARSGEELFREILFPNAQAAAAVPELRRLYEFAGMNRMSADEHQAIASVQQVIVEGVAEIDATFFARFAERIQSGKVMQVDQAMTEANQLLGRALAAWSSDIEALLSAEGVAALDARLDQTVGSERRRQVLAQLQKLDPAALQALVGMVRKQTAAAPASASAPAGVTVGTALATAAVLTNSTALDRAQSLVNSTVTSTAHQVTRTLATATTVNNALVRSSNINLALDRAIAAQIRNAVDINLHDASAIQLNTAAQINRVVNLSVQQSVDHQLAQSVGGVVAVEHAVVVVLVVAAAVAVWLAAVPQPGMGYVNGESTDLFHDQLIGNITRAYAR
jgi:SdpC family antimicrobial peptide